MREGIGETFTYNMIILFIIIVFGILSATISYYKAYKVNNRILDSIEKYEGYNDLARTDIQNKLQTIGYTHKKSSDKCPTRNGMELESEDGTYLYCVYYQSDDRGSLIKNETNANSEPIYYNYGVTSYIYIDLPIVGAFKVPVFTKGERTYNFSCKTCNASGECTIKDRAACERLGA